MSKNSHLPIVSPMDPRSLTLFLLLTLLFTAHSYSFLPAPAPSPAPSPFPAPSPAPAIGSPHSSIPPDIPPLSPPQGPPKLVVQPSSLQRSPPVEVHNLPPPDLKECPPGSRDCTPHRQPVWKNVHLDPQDPNKNKLNKGKELGLMLAGTAVALQVVLVGFLVYKARRIRQFEYAQQRISSRSTLPSASV